MRYDFSSAFLVIKPPATNFGEAWELLCADLLSAEHGGERIQRLAPPDSGIDIFNRTNLHAYQCKASEQGAAGTIAPGKSIDSLQSAVRKRAQVHWDAYSFCTNAPYSTEGLAKIREAATELAIDKEELGFLGPEYWEELCKKFEETIRDRFYYRVTAGEKDVVDAFKKAGYYQKYVDRFAESIQKHDFSVVITNNRTPVEIEIPFSPDLTVENYLDAAKQLLGVTLEWTNYPDMETSAGTSLSVTVDQYAQTFSTKLGEIPIESGDSLQLWIKIVWREKTKESAPSDQEVLSRRADAVLFSKDLLTYRKFEVPLLKSALQSPRDRQKVTVQRHEALVQGLIWNSFRDLKGRTLMPSVASDVRRFKSRGLHSRDLAELDDGLVQHLAALLGEELRDTDRLNIELLRQVSEEDE